MDVICMRLKGLNNLLVPYFRYRTPKYILVEVPIVGIIHRLGQIGALIYVVTTMVIGSTWAVASVPLGSTNPWVETGGYAGLANTTLDYSAAKEYCSNPANAYDYGGGWLYGTEDDPPLCNSPSPFTITEKTTESVFFTTAFIESSEKGFPCVLPVNKASDLLICTNWNAASTLYSRANGQCVCTTPPKTFYPLGIEEMEVSFAHFYNTPTLKTGRISGGSVDDGAEHPLETKLLKADGSTVVWKPPSIITISLRELLSSAHHASCERDSVADGRDGKLDGKCAMGIVLDEPNVDVEHDVGNETKFPVFRTTGVSLDLQITYTNANKEKRAELDNQHNVKTTIMATVQTGAWSSVGGTATYKTYPYGDVGGETWELNSRYKQGVMVNMKSSGTIYTFNVIYLIQALITGLVLLKFSNNIADFVAFNLLPGGQSVVLGNKRAEKVSRKSEFAETGLKAALASFQFGFFDRDHNGTIESVDIMRSFANIEGADGNAAVTAEQAHAIATAIMEDADTDNLNDSKGALDFSEYMTCLDGDAIAFKEFLKTLKPRKDLDDFEDCLEAYSTQRVVVEERKVARKPFAERHPSMAKGYTKNYPASLGTSQITSSGQIRQTGDSASKV